MPNEILPYIEMCQREGLSLQKGMNFQVGGTHSVILMSLRKGAPYEDEIMEGGSVLIYEGHDVNRTTQTPDPKNIDQPEYLPSRKPTENGKFHKAAQAFKSGVREPERVRVYEKIRNGIWSYNGIFHLTDSWIQDTGKRKVFKFRLEAVEGEEDLSQPVPEHAEKRRIIPTHVKLEVWKRDGGKCAKCGSSENLHFDHVIPYSRGGSSDTAQNVQLLCGKHNLEKRDKIE